MTIRCRNCSAHIETVDLQLPGNCDGGASPEERDYIRVSMSCTNCRADYVVAIDVDEFEISATNVDQLSEQGTTMLRVNHSFNAALKSAMGALHALDDAGIGVVEIKMTGGRPTIRVDQVPATIEGVTKIYRGREAVLAAPFLGAQLEWSAFAATPRRAAGSVA